MPAPESAGLDARIISYTPYTQIQSTPYIQNCKWQPTDRRVWNAAHSKALGWKLPWAVKKHRGQKHVETDNPTRGESRHLENSSPPAQLNLNLQWPRDFESRSQ